jgi:integrase
LPRVERERKDVPGVTHTLRKTFLTRWSRRFPINVVKEWAGHDDERTTMPFYLKVCDMECNKAAGCAPHGQGR